MLGAVKALQKTPLLLCGKELTMPYADWFENTLAVNLPKERKVVVVMDSAKCHCRFIAKVPTMKMKKG